MKALGGVALLCLRSRLENVDENRGGRGEAQNCFRRLLPSLPWRSRLHCPHARLFESPLLLGRMGPPTKKRHEERMIFSRFHFPRFRHLNESLLQPVRRYQPFVASHSHCCSFQLRQKPLHHLSQTRPHAPCLGFAPFLLHRHGSARTLPVTSSPGLPRRTRRPHSPRTPPKPLASPARVATPARFCQRRGKDQLHPLPRSRRRSL
mmetsp:Transcript_282/g.492  ORF Transcript_282/g.492 Transcript_282/m.492 type:complete len:206 (+) Transcript_282:1496-2113(+)